MNVYRSTQLSDRLTSVNFEILFGRLARETAVASWIEGVLRTLIDSEDFN